MKLDDDILTREEAQAMDAVGVAYIEHTVGDWYEVHVLVQEFSRNDETLKVRCSFTPFRSKDPSACVDWLYSRWPSVKVVTREEYDDVFWGPGGRPSGKLFARRDGSAAVAERARRALRNRPGVQQGANAGVPSAVPNVHAARPRQRATPVPESVTDDSWIPAVQAAHYLGIPPQYMYQRIAKGRVKTQGERPKLVRWGDVKRG